MPQVSKRILDSKVEAKIKNTLLDAVSQVRSREDVSAFVNDLLSPVEKTMLSKRLAIAILINRGWEYPAICNFLKVSSGTVAKISILIKHKSAYVRTIKKLEETEAGREFFADLAIFAHKLGVHKDLFVSDELLKRKFGLEKKTL